MASAGITMKGIAFSLQNVAANATIKDTPMISVPVPTALPYFGTSSSYNIRVAVFKVSLQELEEKCYTVMDAVDWSHHLPQDGFKEAPTTALYEFVN